MKRIYLDYAATTPAHPDVIKAMIPYWGDIFGNPSSIHSDGQEARQAIEEARHNIAQLIGAQSGEIVFTSGGTEADNFAIKGVTYSARDKGAHIITTSIEHHAVLETCHFLEKAGFTVTYLPVDSQGMVDPDDVRKAVTPRTVLISVMHANNEVGTIEPVASIGRIAREAGVYFHTDAVQTVGHIPVDVDSLGVDLLSISAHKLYGPKGVGALYIKEGTRITPLLHGGEQEKGYRAGTQNVPGIVGFGRAAEIARAELASESRRLCELRDFFIRELQKVDGIHLNGHPAERLPGNINVSLLFVEGESVCLNLDLEGVSTSTGSACSSSSMEPSHVLLAMGLSPEAARSSLRFSLGKWTTRDEILQVLEIVPRVLNRLRAISSLYRK